MAASSVCDPLPTPRPIETTSREPPAATLRSVFRRAAIASILILPPSRLGTEILVRLKWGQHEYKGNLVSLDSYMNIQLNNAEEYINGKHNGTLGQVVIRCNNILWVTKFEGTEMTDMTGEEEKQE
ncbi:hypothetical protein N7532_005241 [Penicillium argentinense]|uniref:Sm protein F n=1 Tax=Penicillium argentinense TaxID=1131581 RepID=A0A9W9FDJ0_9EURO|nr:uncharacterized protein N7532_005241 [Penicillium argentinense]KAJ5098240.1 hypothetical protein N7532_005241 [Penicillium argentinense]